MAGISTGILAGTLSVFGSGELVDYTVNTAGTETFDSPVAYGTLKNAVSSGAVVFDQSAYEVTPEKANSFTNFEAVANSSTTFLGGWWDFGGGAFLPTDASGRTVTFDGKSVVTNVGAVTLAGSAGTGNALCLKGGSAFDAASVAFGSKSPDQRSTVRVEGGSSLNCRGNFFLSRFQVSTATNAKNLTGNLLCVTGALSRLTVGGIMSVGGKMDGTNGTFGYGGGNTLEVVDGARADFAAVDVCRSARQGQRNRLHFGKNTRVNMTSMTVSDAGASGYPAASNVIEIVDGACVTNTGAFVFGASGDIARGANELLVSNATFSVAKCYVYSSVNYFLCGPNSVFRLSGPDAKFVSEMGINAFFKGNGCSFVVENGATYDWKWGQGAYCNTVAASDETVWVRTGATLNCPNGIQTVGVSNVGRTGSARNKLVVESDAKLTAVYPGGVQILGTDAELTVDDGVIECPVNLVVGLNERSYDTNCLMRVCGSHPKVTISWNLQVQNGSCLRFELPQTGYDEDAATSDNPLLTVGTVTAGKGVFFDTTSRLELTGVKELQAYHQERNLRREYVLIHSNTGGINLPEGQLEALQAQLPEGVSLSIRTVKNNWKDLVLSVKPVKGLVLIVR